MSPLGARHVARTRLTARLAEGRVAMVWAGGGCGKTALAAEHRGALGIPAVEVRLDPGDREPERLVGRIRRALMAAGRSDALLAVTEAQPDPRAALETFVDALAAEPDPVLVVFDDVHHADDAAGALLATLAADLPPQHRLLLLGRAPPPALASVRDAVVLGTAELAFTPEETRALAPGLEPDEAQALIRATGGWAAPLMVAAARLARAGDRAAELRELTEHTSLLAHLVDGLLADLPPEEREQLVALAHLPLIADGTDVARRALSAGLPLTRVRDGWSELAGGVQEHLAGLAPLRAEVARDAADTYLRAGEVRAAVTVLLRAGCADDAAALVAGLRPDRVDRLDFGELRALVAVLPEDALRRHPRVLLHYARACQPAAQLAERADALARAAAAGGDDALGRELDAERALDLIRDNDPDRAEALAAAVLEAVGEEEAATRARALDVLGRAAAHRGDPASLERAEGLLEASLVLCRALNQQSWVAQVLLALADRVLYVRGQHAEAIARIDELLAGLAGRSRYRAVTLSFRATMLVDSGRHDEAEATFAEIERLATVTADARAAGYLAWSRAQLLSQRGDVAGTVAALREAEAHSAEWFEHSTGAEFLAEAADLLDRVGETELAGAYLARARQRAGQAPLHVEIAAAAIAARSGDPAAARTALRSLGGVQRRDGWRMTLLEAHAALRAGDDDAAALARRAFGEADALGSPSLPLARERRVAERLLREARPDIAVTAAPDVRILGTFAVSSAGRELVLPEGRPQTLVKLLAAHGGRLAADEAIETLWPGAAPDSARKNLRNVLHRLRAADVELVVRDGDRLRLAEGARVDAVDFERAARQALESGEALAIARAAAAYAGDLLPDDRYADWAHVPRERARLLAVELLDRLADQVEARGELDESLRLIERAIALDPHEERRYLLAARILLEQGRRARALETLERGAAALRGIGLPVPAALSRLAESVRRP